MKNLYDFDEVALRPELKYFLCLISHTLRCGLDDSFGPLDLRQIVPQNKLLSNIAFEAFEGNLSFGPPTNCSSK